MEDNSIRWVLALIFLLVIVGVSAIIYVTCEARDSCMESCLDHWQNVDECPFICDRWR